MRIDIYRHTGKRFIAVPEGHAIPESWAGARYFKTIDLLPGDIRIGMGDAAQVLAGIGGAGYAVI